MTRETEKTFYIRVRQEKVGYYAVKAKTLNEAESEALYRLHDETDGEVCPSVDYEQYDPSAFERAEHETLLKTEIKMEEC